MTDERPTDAETETAAATERVRSDGGTAASRFTTTADVEETRWDRYRRTYEAYLKTPVMIIRTDPRAIIGLGILGMYVLFGFVAAVLMEPTRVFEGPEYVRPFQTMEFPLGTNGLGQDLTYQALHSIIPLGQMMISGALFTVVVGTAVGVTAGYKGGTVDRVLTTITDVFINLPGLPLVIVLAILFEPQSEALLGILLTIAAWAGLARAIRSQVLTICSESHVEAARAMDIPTHRLIYRDVLPQLMPYVAVNTAQAAQSVIFGAVGLYFLGILPYTGANWGTMLSQAYAEQAFFNMGRIHWVIIPLVFITVLSIGLVLLAQSLDRVFNPRVRARHAERADIDEMGVEETEIQAGMGGQM